VASIQKRARNGRVTYRARYRDPAGREHARVFARKIDAQRFLTEVENAKLKGAWTDPALGRVLFRDWFAEWQRTTARLRPNTEARDERLFRLHVLPRFGAMPLGKLGPRDVRAWVAGLAGTKLAPSTVQRCYQLLSKVMAAAVDAGMLPQSPCRRVPLPKVERQEMRFLTPAEVAAWPTRPRRATGPWSCWAPTAGCASARWPACEVITEPRGVLHVGPPKTEAGRRTVELPRFVVDALAELLAVPGAPEAYVFAGPQGGALRVSLFRSRFWRPAVKAAGLGGLRIHDLRHTAVALWIAAGANPKEVAARAGHASVSFTLDRYGHLYPEADLGLRERLDAMFAASQRGDS
jgi:integrase